MKVIATSVLVLSTFLFSTCNPKVETWINGSTDLPDNRISFSGNKVMIQTKELDDFDREVKIERTYTIVEKMVNDKISTQSLYILKNDSGGKYSMLPEFVQDASHRKFDLRERFYEFETREEQTKKLNEKMSVNKAKLGVDSLERKYLFFGAAIAIGVEFVRKY